MFGEYDSLLAELTSLQKQYFPPASATPEPDKPKRRYVRNARPDWQPCPVCNVNTCDRREPRKWECYMRKNPVYFETMFGVGLDRLQEIKEWVLAPTSERRMS